MYTQFASDLELLTQIYQKFTVSLETDLTLLSHILFTVTGTTTGRSFLADTSRNAMAGICAPRLRHLNVMCMSGGRRAVISVRTSKMSFNNQNLSFAISCKHLAVSSLVALGLALGIYSSPVKASDAAVSDQKTGRETGLPLPRFVSLKSKTVNLRVGPGRKYAILWQYQKRGLPVEVIQEFDQWRRIRDSDGSTGWVLHSLLSARRTAVVAPWEKAVVEFGKPVDIAFFDGKKSAHKDANTVARLQAGLIVNVDECEANWCSVEAQSTRSWLKQEALWGVYPNEEVED